MRYAATGMQLVPLHQPWVKRQIVGASAGSQPRHITMRSPLPLASLAPVYTAPRPQRRALARMALPHGSHSQASRGCFAIRRSPLYLAALRGSVSMAYRTQRRRVGDL
jgi:hypothetical protein